MPQASEDLAIGIAHKLGVTASLSAAAVGAAETGGVIGFLGRYSSEIAAIGVIVGVILGVLGLAVQVIFLHRKDKRESAECTWRMGIDPDRRKNSRPPGDPHSC